jgi:hypothetical protein
MITNRDRCITGETVYFMISDGSFDENLTFAKMLPIDLGQSSSPFLQRWSFGSGDFEPPISLEHFRKKMDVPYLVTCKVIRFSGPIEFEAAIGRHLNTLLENLNKD